MIEVKIIKKPKGTSASSVTTGISTSYTQYAPSSVKEAAHAKEADEAKHAISADTATNATSADSAKTADEATHATSAYKLDENSPTRDDFLSAISDDTAAGIITFLKGLIAKGVISAQGGITLDSDMTSSLFDKLAETGLGLTKDTAGNWSLFLKNITVWGKAVFRELEIRRLSYVGGDFIFSPAGCTIDSVVAIDADGNEVAADSSDLYAYRCYYVADDGTTATTNSFMVDDQALCQTFNIREGVYENVSNRYYWRRVLAAETGYIDLSATDYDTSATNDVPQKGDVLCCVGNRTNTDRQNLIKITTEGSDAPAIEMYHGVYNYHLGKWTDTAGVVHNNRTSIFSPSLTEINTNYFRLTDGVESAPMVIYRGEWSADETYYYYDQVTHDDATWLCVVPDGEAVTSEPTIDNAEWKLVAGTPTRSRSMTIYLSYINGSIILPDGMIAEGETQNFICKVSDNKDKDHTSEYTVWSIVRDTGDSAADTVWNQNAVINNDGSFSLSYGNDKNDIGGGNYALFTVTALIAANDSTNAVSQSFVI